MEDIEMLATVGLGETFNPADAPDEKAWQDTMVHAPTEKLRLELQSAWQYAFACAPDRSSE